ncbi:hypothetical protein BGZ65_005340, partial [Modicella reniformis]
NKVDGGFKIPKVDDIMADLPNLSKLQFNLLNVQLFHLEAFSESFLLSDQKEASYFPREWIQERDEGFKKYLEIKNDSSEIVEPLLKMLKTGDLKKLIEHLPSVEAGYINSQRRGMKVPTKWRGVLDVIKDLCSFAECKWFVEPSESDIVHKWVDVMFYLLRGTKVFVKSGERVSASSRAVKGLLNDEFGSDFGTHGRKVDFLFHSMNFELANFEFKATNLKSLCNVQHLKNVRLNRAIMEDCFAVAGLREPILFIDAAGKYKHNTRHHTLPVIVVSIFSNFQRVLK